MCFLLTSCLHACFYGRIFLIMCSSWMILLLCSLVSSVDHILTPSMSVNLSTKLNLSHHTVPVIFWYGYIFVDISASISCIFTRIVTSSVLYEVIYLGFPYTVRLPFTTPLLTVGEWMVNHPPLFSLIHILFAFTIID